VRAVVIREFGPPGVLVPAEVPEPELAAGQALIDVEIANVTFVETQVRAGKAPNPAMLPELPAIPGNGVGGTLTAVGDGVDPELIGARVVSSTGGTGAYAELVAVDAAGVITVPDELELADAVALLADGRTALALMRGAEVQSGETVLVEAAAGGVGSLLVQLSRNAGATVVAAAGGENKLALAAELGADLAVDYTQPDWAQQVEPVDVVFDGVGGPIGLAAFDLLRPGGRFSIFGLASGSFTAIPDEEAARRDISVIRGSRVAPEEMLQFTRAGLAEAAAGRLRPVVGQTFPLDRAADAHAAIEARATLGKTLLLTR
jgi:NADPH2:quinone reductase